MVSPFASITNNEIESQIIKQAVTFPKYTRRVMKIGLEALTGEAWTWIYQWKWLQIFCSKCKLSLVLIYLADMFINKIKTKFNSFLQNRFKYKKKIRNSFWRHFLPMVKQMPSKVLFVSKKMWQPFGLLHTKIVNVGSSKWVNNHHFYVQLSHCFTSQLCKYPLATHTEVNNNYATAKSEALEGSFKKSLSQVIQLLP